MAPRNLLPKSEPDNPTGRGAVTKQPSRRSSGAPRKHQTTACDACRRKKSKCIGDVPCEACVATGTQCVKINHDGRTKESKQSALHALMQETQGTLAKFVETLHEDKEADIDHFVMLLKEGTPLDQISQYLERQKQREDSPGSILSDVVEDALLQVEDLKTQEQIMFPIDDTQRESYPAPPYNVPAKPWTSVTDDDELVSVLISLFFTWLQPHLFRFVEKDSFLKDMQSGIPNSKFCSAFLCNGILAEACTYYDVPEKDSLTEKFLSEARRLWEEESGKVSLTNVQGLMCLSIRERLLGKDRTGWLLLTQALAMQNNLERHIRNTNRSSPDPPSQLMREAVFKTGWTVFALQNTTALALMKPASQPPPNILPEANCSQEDEQWTPYPLPLAARPMHSACGFRAECEITTILRDLCQVYYGHEDSPLSPPQIEQTLQLISRKLSQWHRKLPSCLLIQGSPPPRVFCLHGMYHWAQIVLLGFLQKARAQIAEHAGASSESKADGQIRYGGVSPSRINIDAAQKTASLSQLYPQLYGYSYFANLYDAADRDRSIHPAQRYGDFIQSAGLCQLMCDS